MVAFRFYGLAQKVIGVDCFRAQVQIQKSLKHENVVALLTHHLIDCSIAVVLEFCDNGSMRQLLAKTAGGLLTEPVSRRYFTQMFDAVSYLHSSSIVHRDISVDKFLLDARDRVKLSNFGTAMPYAAGDTFFTSRQVIQSQRSSSARIMRILFRTIKYVKYAYGQIYVM